MGKELEALRRKGSYTEEDMLVMHRLLTEQVMEGQELLQKLRMDLISKGLLSGPGQTRAFEGAQDRRPTLIKTPAC